MTSSTDTTKKRLDPSIISRLRGIVLRVRGFAFVDGVTWSVAVLVATALVQFALDYGFRGLQWSMRAAMLLAIVVMIGVVVWRRMIRPWLIPFDVTDAAKLIERKNPKLSSLLISAVRFSRGEVGPETSNSPALVASVISHAGREARFVDYHAVLNPYPVYRASITTIVLLVLCGVLMGLRPDLASMWFNRSVLLKETPWPKQTYLVVDLPDGELVGARGDDWVVEAYAKGAQPREVEISFETTSGKRGKEPMVTVGGKGAYRYRYTFRAAREDFQFYLEGGDDRTEVFRARLLERPRIRETQMIITPPEYTPLAPAKYGDGQWSAEMLLGSKVEIRFRTNHAVIEATLMSGREPVAGAFPAEALPVGASWDDSWYTVTIVPEETRTLHVHLVDETGLENKHPARFSLRVQRDEAPRVRLSIADVGDMITPEAELPIQLEFADEYGLATAELVSLIEREGQVEERATVPDGFTSHIATLSSSISWSVISDAVMPGQSLTFFARGSDHDNVSGPNVAQSPEIRLRVVTQDELLAELARREQQWRLDFQRLVDQQESLRSRLLTALGRLAESDDHADVAQATAPFERSQRNIAASVNVVRQQFERILGELRVNQLDTLEVQERLEQGIITPLKGLAGRDLVVAADTIRQWSNDGSSETATLIDPQQVTLLMQMRAVLDRMLQWEGYQEVVSMLRDIIRLQGELNEESKKASEQQALDLFDE